MPNNCIAAVDMGTNSFHLIIARVKKDGTFKVIDREREIIRLGSHKGKGLSYITDEETELAIKTLKGFKELAEFYEAEFRAVATSAVRESNNREEFVNAIKKATGIKIEVIKGREEANLIFKGTMKALDLYDKSALCIDIGGGSTEIILGNNGEPEFAESVKIGAVRLSKMFFPDYVITDSAVKNCQDYITQALSSKFKSDKKYKFEIAVGSSGTIEAAAAMISYLRDEKPPKSLNGFSFKQAELKEITNIVMMKRTPEERLSVKGMEAKRADIIPAGLLILNSIFELFKIREMTISGFALREGIILEMIESRESL